MAREAYLHTIGVPQRVMSRQIATQAARENEFVAISTQEERYLCPASTNESIPLSSLQFSKAFRKKSSASRGVVAVHSGLEDLVVECDLE